MGLYIILMGVQGAGKGMQASYISETYNIPHVSTGDIFRSLKTRTDDLAVRVKNIMDAGNLVDDATTNELVADRLNQADAKDGVILDGYPRNQVQADFLSQYLAEKGEKVDSVLFLDLDLYIAFKRAFGRVTDKETGESYNYFYKKDDVDFSVEKSENSDFPPRIVGTLNGKVLKRRTDDADALAVINRIETYLEETMPIVDYYRDQGIVTEIHADMPIEVVSYYIKTVLDNAK
ncbi:MAG: nucleoside monophosphate kinase [Chloroflexota bacterium]